MTKKRKMRASVQKVIRSTVPSEPEKVQISVEEGDELYREIRIENVVTDEKGQKARLKPGAEVDVVIEADSSATIKKPDWADCRGNSVSGLGRRRLLFASIRHWLGSIQRFGGKISDERRMLGKQRIQFGKKCWYFGIVYRRCALAQLPDPLLDWVKFHDR
jgi:hypothetical protein